MGLQDKAANKAEELKGKARQAGDKVQRTVRDTRDDVRSEADKAREREREHEVAHEPRSR